jgi:cholinesterase
MLKGDSFRSNIFGYPNAPGIPDVNLGLLDQRLAVEWVRTNIEGFGGDSKRITLFGADSGGAAADMWAYAWRDYDPIINGIIAESGSAAVGTQNLRMMDNKDYTAWFTASAKVGCGGKEAGAKTIACMRTKPYEQILNAITVDLINPLAISFGPTPDNKIVFADWSNMSRTGDFHKVVGAHTRATGVLDS